MGLERCRTVGQPDGQGPACWSLDVLLVGTREMLVLMLGFCELGFCSGTPKPGETLGHRHKLVCVEETMQIEFICVFMVSSKLVVIWSRVLIQCLLVFGN